jgi:iron complex outermembrane receptor protein
VAPTDRTTISFDGVYSQLDNRSRPTTRSFRRPEPQQHQGTANQATYQLANANIASTAAQRRALYASCNARAETDILPAVDCGQQMNGTTPGGAGLRLGYSFNPNNLEPYDYYNNPTSRGYVATIRRQLAMRDAHRPSVVRLIDAALSPRAERRLSGAGQCRHALGRGRGALHDLLPAGLDQPRSRVQRHPPDARDLRREPVGQQGPRLAGRLHPPELGLGVAGNGYFVYDARGGGDMPSMNFGFDVADPTKWDVVKGFSAIRYFDRAVDNHYEGGRVDFAYDADENITLKFGASQRRYTFYTTALQRESAVRP